MTRNRTTNRKGKTRTTGRISGQARIARTGRGRRPPALSPRKRPTQARAQETVSAVLAAATELFADGGPARTTTNRIAERAGVSVGSLYQYFPNKEAILAALHERHGAQIEATIGGAYARLADPSIPLGRSMRELVDGLCAVHDADPQLTRAVSAPLPHVPRLEASLRKHGEEHEVQVEAVLRKRGDVRAGDRAVMARLLIQAFEALTRWLAHEVPPGRGRDVATDEVVRMIVWYLER